MTDNNASDASQQAETGTAGLPKKLLGGYAQFRSGMSSQQKQRFEELAEHGQKPETTVISCCDSRAAPEAIFDTGPGELFVVRNVANVVSPYDSNDHNNSTAAAIEFAVQALGVKHILVMGHARCGGVDAYRRKLIGDPIDALSAGNFIGKWITLLEPVAGIVDRSDDDTAEKLQFKLETASVRQSIEHLKSYPFIAERYERGQIGLHGAWFDISNGELLTMNGETGEFEMPLN
jgi:carbonic anhydrase